MKYRIRLSAVHTGNGRNKKFKPLSLLLKVQKTQMNSSSVSRNRMHFSIQERTLNFSYETSHKHAI